MMCILMRRDVRIYSRYEVVFFNYDEGLAWTVPRQVPELFPELSNELRCFVSIKENTAAHETARRFAGRIVLSVN